MENTGFLYVVGLLAVLVVFPPAFGKFLGWLAKRTRASITPASAGTPGKRPLPHR